ELRPHMTSYCTFTWGDSYTTPEHVGTPAAFEPVLAALLESVETTGEALGVGELDVPSLVRRLASTRPPAHFGSVGRALDAYIEAQVHSSVDLARDVAALVIDPAFHGTATGDRLNELAARYGFALASHPGFVVSVAEVSADFRGPRMVPLAARVGEQFARSAG